MRAELAGMIVRKDEARRIVYGPVLVPGEPDSDGDVVTAEKIEQVAHRWMELYQNNDVMHSLINRAVPVESYVTPTELQYQLPSGESVTIPKGTWMLGSKVQDDATWQKVLKGELTGFSIMAVSAAALKSVGASGVAASLKRVTLADLGPDWEVVAVSLVDDPAVPKAKWVAVKSRKGADSPEQELGTLWDRLARLVGIRSADKAGRSISDATLAQLARARDAHKEALSVLEELIRLAESERGKSSKEADEMTQDEMRQVVQEAVGAGIQPLTEAINQLAAALQGGAAGASGAEGEKGKAPSDKGKPGENSGSEKGKTSNNPEEKPGDDQATIEALKKQVEQLEAQLAGSRSLKGQDSSHAAGDAGTATSDRDLWGRKRRAGSAG